jgi:hypothetical protein
MKAVRTSENSVNSTRLHCALLQKTIVYIELRHDRFRSHDFEFIINYPIIHFRSHDFEFIINYPIIQRYIVRATDSVDK